MFYKIDKKLWILCDRACKNWPSEHKQVDILISKNQAQQILYLKHRVYNETT